MQWVYLPLVSESCYRSLPLLAGTAVPRAAPRSCSACCHTRQSLALTPWCLRHCLCTGSSWCAVSDKIIHLWVVEQLASFIVWNVLILLSISKVGNISPSWTLFIIVLPSPSFLGSSLSFCTLHPHPLFSLPSHFFWLSSRILSSLSSPASQLSKKKDKSFTKMLGKKPCNHMFNFISFCHLPKQACTEPGFWLACRGFSGDDAQSAIFVSCWVCLRCLSEQPKCMFVVATPSVLYPVQKEEVDRCLECCHSEPWAWGFIMRENDFFHLYIIYVQGWAWRWLSWATKGDSSWTSERSVTASSAQR